MKRKSTYMLVGLAVIPLSLILIINGINNRMIYNLTNESGDRKVMENLKLVSYQNNEKRNNQSNYSAIII
ncbi:MAG: hypothetical protein SPJ62_00010 [Inconstantimicrobium porci]|uniref:hypothetical protein n=1 Tax=Inconstantimicrobium porci TaxID=2652291 RepID=UPI002A913C24|nr:hypothetical protein [Inconstantimicrobium porci]MDY5910410.1 hypothetical protein [Inconstantimicrobium porci]